MCTMSLSVSGSIIVEDSLQILSYDSGSQSYHEKDAGFVRRQVPGEY